MAVAARNGYLNVRPRSCFAASKRSIDAVYGWDQIAMRFARIAQRKRRDTAFFFRHGETKYNERNLVSGQHNTVLSSEGKIQASHLSATIPKKLDLIVCSALVRSVQTMELSVPQERRVQIPVFVDPRLNEVNLGVLQGRRRRYLREFEQGDLDFAPDHGESYRQAAQRVLSTIVDIFDLLATRGASPRIAAVFCHAGVLRIISTLTNCSNDPKEVFKVNLANAERVGLEASHIHLPEYWKKEY
ncbi:histidine phosphatase family protein [Gluconobacter sphaericus]|uniref:histidine phosphatase family protein n=1 Tax=Gluconobacter sphaericus TaxID=574987 RepID=UPI00312B6781